MPNVIVKGGSKYFRNKTREPTFSTLTHFSAASLHLNNKTRGENKMNRNKK